MTTSTLIDTSRGSWQVDPGFGVYVHIPFCRHRCHYCDFNTYEGQDALHDAYVGALNKDIERWPGDSPTATSVFFGGGTPTLLPADALGTLLRSVVNRFGLVPDAEVTIEANPETIDSAKLGALRRAGFNRISIGMQSGVDRVLAGLGRTHSAARALDAVGAAKRAELDSVNVDLIYGSPWESPADWRASLEMTIAAEPDHISAYALTVEEGTPLATLVASGRAPDIDPDVQAARTEVAVEMLAGAGYERYEISNWARPGHASRHNVLYWSAGNYAGFGAGAHAHEDGRRSWVLRRPADYIVAVDGGHSTEAGHEVVAGRARGAEALVLGLRLTAGIPLDRFEARFGASYLAEVAPRLAELEEPGLLEWDASRLRLTPRGHAFHSEVARRLL